MSHPDFNLLITLNVLLAEANVARAAERLHLSPSAMSRALARLRETTGDPLLVRAGRGLVPTPRAMELRASIGQLVEAAQAILRPAQACDPGRLERDFCLRCSDGFVENFGAALIARVQREAPGVRLFFTPKLNKDNAPLRDGSVDLETGVVGEGTGPEIVTRTLFRDRFVAVVRPDHALSEGEMSLERYVAGRHVLVSRRGLDRGPLDEALLRLGLERAIVTRVGGFASAIALTRASDLIATVPERHTGNLRAGLFCFPLPEPLASLAPKPTIAMLWHPRMHADAAHRWLRSCVQEVCGEESDSGAGANVA